MSFNRTEDQVGVLGSILFHAFLFFIFALLMMSGCSEDPTDPLDGAVAVSIGHPDMGGPDQSTSVAEQAEPQPEEEVAEEQVTSDDAEAPEVQSNPNPTPNNPTPTPSEPTETEPERQVDSRSQWKPGSGSGSGDGDETGDQGQEDGSDQGEPEGSGSSGTGGTGFSGDGFSGKINGFKVVAAFKPENHKQEFGKVTVRVCVDKNGKVISVKPGGTPTTNTSKHLENLSIQAAWKFTFKRIGDATAKNCGYITFNYRAG